MNLALSDSLSEYYSRYIASRVNAAEIRIRIGFYGYNDPFNDNMQIIIYVDEKPNPYKHAHAGELKSW